MHFEERLLDRVFRVRDIAEVVVGDAFHTVTMRPVDLLEDSGVSRSAGTRQTNIVIGRGARRSVWSLGGNHWAR